MSLSIQIHMTSECFARVSLELNTASGRAFQLAGIAAYYICHFSRSIATISPRNVNILTTQSKHRLKTVDFVGDSKKTYQHRVTELSR